MPAAERGGAVRRLPVLHAATRRLGHRDRRAVRRGRQRRRRDGVIRNIENGPRRGPHRGSGATPNRSRSHNRAPPGIGSAPARPAPTAAATPPLGCPLRQPPTRRPHRGGDAHTGSCSPRHDTSSSRLEVNPRCARPGILKETSMPHISRDPPGNGPWSYSRKYLGDRQRPRHPRPAGTTRRCPRQGLGRRRDHHRRKPAHRHRAARRPGKHHRRLGTRRRGQTPSTHSRSNKALARKSNGLTPSKISRSATRHEHPADPRESRRSGTASRRRASARYASRSVDRCGMHSGRRQRR